MKTQDGREDKKNERKEKKKVHRADRKNAPAHCVSAPST